MRKELHQASGDVLELRKAVYVFCQCAQEEIQTVTLYLASKLRRWTVVSTTHPGPMGMVCTASWHVGDLLGGGDEIFSGVSAQLCNFFQFGLGEKNGASHSAASRGCTKCRWVLEVDVEVFRQSLQTVPFPRERREQPDALTATVIRPSAQVQEP